MPTKLHGMLRLSKVPKELIQTLHNGEKVLWVDIMDNYNGQADQFGNTHVLVVYDSKTKSKHYLGNFKPVEFGNAQAKVSVSTPATPPPPPIEEGEDDLPI